MKPPLSYEALRQVIIEQQEEIVRFRNMPLIERDKMKELSKFWIKIGSRSSWGLEDVENLS